MNTVRKPGTASTEIDAFLATVNTMPVPTGNARGRLIFAMDATMSRQPTWDTAIGLQGQMFVEAQKAGGLAVQLVYFRGFNECKASRWVEDATTLANVMGKVECRGGNTQICRVLGHAKSEISKSKVDAVIFVGDACEEAIDSLCQQAGELGLMGTPVFMFQEGGDSAAERAFREIAKLTRGAYFRLDANAPHILSELLRAVAAYAAGGKKALQAQAGSPAKALLQQMN